MKALTFHGKRDVRIDNVPDPIVEDRTDAVIRVPERLARSQSHGVETIDVSAVDNVPGAVRELTGGRGPDSVIDAVGMEAHGAPAAGFAHRLVGMMPDAIARKVMENAGIDKLSVLNLAVEIVRRGGTISLSGVYGGTADPLNMLQMFDKQLTLKMGQANVRRWVDEILPLLTNGDDPFGVDSFATHHLPLDDAPAAYEMFQKKEDGAFKVVFKP